MINLQHFEILGWSFGAAPSFSGSAFQGLFIPIDLITVIQSIHLEVSLLIQCALMRPLSSVHSRSFPVWCVDLTSAFQNEVQLLAKSLNAYNFFGVNAFDIRTISPT